MHKIIRIARLLFVLVSAAALCSAQTAGPPAPSVEYDPNAWKEFVSREGRFSVRMPAEPKLNTREINTAMGKVNINLYVAMADVKGYMAAYGDFPEYSEAPEYIKAALDGARDRVMTGGTERQLLFEKELVIEGFPAREWLIADSQMVFRAQTFLAKGRLYQLVLLVPMNIAFSKGKASAHAADRTAPYEEMAGRFFGSFKLLPATAAQPAPARGVALQGAPAEGEVDGMLKRLREKGELLVGVCAEGEDCDALPDVQGVTAENRGRLSAVKVLNKPQPVYPPIAKAARAQGKVTVQVVVDEEGKVIAAQALSGHPLLQAAAVKAAREALFAPILLDTKPVKMGGTITYTFVLQQ